MPSYLDTIQEKANLGYPAVLSTPNTQTMGNFQTTNPNTPVDASTLSPGTPLNVPPNDNPLGDVSGAMGGLLAATNKAAQESQKEVDTSLTDIQNLTKQLEGQTAEQQTLEAGAGLPEMNKELRDLRTLKSQQLGSYLSSYNQAISRKSVGTIKSAEENQIVRQHAVDSLFTDALINAKEGNIASANASVERALALKYNPLRQAIENKKFVLEQIKGKAAQDAKNKFDVQLKEIEKQEQREKDKEKLIIDASQFAPTDLITKARAAKTPLEAAQILGKYGGDYLGNKVKQSQIDRNYAELDKIREEIKQSRTPVNVSSTPNTTSGLVTKLLATAKSTKNLEATERQNLSKAMTVIGQLDALQSNISKQNKGSGSPFIRGKVNNLLAAVGANADVGVINAQLQAVVPNLARGTYGEVGVLTDNDIKNYRATLPQLTMPKDQNDAVLALTLKTVKASIENQLRSASNSGINVSGWAEDYTRISNQVNEIEDRIGISKNAVNEIVKNSPNLVPAIKQMYTEGFTDGEILEALNAR